MARKRAKKVQSGGYSYSVSPNNPQVGCREVAPKGSIGSREVLSPHIQEGKRRQRYRLAWIVFSVLLLVLFYGVLVAGTGVVVFAGQ